VSESVSYNSYILRMRPRTRRRPTIHMHFLVFFILMVPFLILLFCIYLYMSEVREGVLAGGRERERERERARATRRERPPYIFLYQSITSARRGAGRKTTKRERQGKREKGGINDNKTPL
jgi:hypothetical protein